MTSDGHHSPCGVRFNAHKVNDEILEEIRKYVKPLPKLQLYKEVITFTFKSKTRLQRNEVKQVTEQLEECNKRISKARDLLLAGDIEADDYRIIKSESEERINRLEAKLAATITDTTNIEPLLNKAISNISQLDILYQIGSIIQKRKIISSMFPEKLTFDGSRYRTNRINEAISLMYVIDSKLKCKKWDKC